VSGGEMKLEERIIGVFVKIIQYTLTQNVIVASVNVTDAQ